MDHQNYENLGYLYPQMVVQHLYSIVYSGDYTQQFLLLLSQQFLLLVTKELIISAQRYQSRFGSCHRAHLNIDFSLAVSHALAKILIDSTLYSVFLIVASHPQTPKKL